jgi:antitoxin YefM
MQVSKRLAVHSRPEARLSTLASGTRILEVLEETLNLLSTPGAVEQIRQAEADIAAGKAIDAAELRRQLARGPDANPLAEWWA